MSNIVSTAVVRMHANNAKQFVTRHATKSIIVTLALTAIVLIAKHIFNNPNNDSLKKNQTDSAAPPKSPKAPTSDTTAAQPESPKAPTSDTTAAQPENELARMTQAQFSKFVQGLPPLPAAREGEEF